MPRVAPQRGPSPRPRGFCPRGGAGPNHGQLCLHRQHLHSGGLQSVLAAPRHARRRPQPGRAGPCPTTATEAVCATREGAPPEARPAGQTHASAPRRQRRPGVGVSKPRWSAPGKKLGVNTLLPSAE
eukprot:4833844-Lingulodinium_polyedra.AAC.2